MDGEPQIAGLAADHKIERINGCAELDEIRCAAVVAHHILPLTTGEQKGIVSHPSDESVISLPTSQRIVATSSVEDIVPIVAGERIIESIPRPVYGIGSGQREVFHVGTEHMGRAGLNRICSLTRGLYHGVS